MEQFDPQGMREDFSRLGWAVIGSQLLMLGLSLAFSLVGAYLLRFFSPLRGTWGQIQGYIAILAAVAGMFPIFYLGQTDSRIERIFDRGEKVWPVQLIFYFLVILGLQLTVTLLSSPLVDLLESVGLSFDQASETATSFSVSQSMMFYSIAVAPICEELVYRGVLLRYLERYGRWFAVVVSAMIFGFMHGNAVQLPIAFAVGLLLGYLALKYSLKVTILLHVMNNLFVELIGRLTSYNQSLGSGLYIGLMLAGVISIVLMLLSDGKPLLRDLRNNKTPHEVYKSFFTSWPVLAALGYMVVLTVSSVVA